MTVSRMVGYEWQCSGGGHVQKVPIWSILDASERPELITLDTPGLLLAACPACGVKALVDAPLLLIRPGNALPVLLALGSDELDQASSPSSPRLAAMAREDRVGHEPLDGPIIPLPRSLLPLALTRDVAEDCADPDRAAETIRAAGVPEPLADWYTAFLRLVRDTEPQRLAEQALRLLLEVRPPDLPEFLRSHPELGSVAALKIARELASAVPERHRYVPRAQLRLVEDMAVHRPVAEVAVEYLSAIQQTGRQLNEELVELMKHALAHQGPDGIPQARAALQLATALGHGAIEAELSADLAVRMLMVPAPDSSSVENAIGLLRRALSLISDDDPRWSSWAGNLAGAYRSRINGDSADNWEIAHSLFDHACAVADREPDLRRRAIIHTNYGLLLSEHPGGSTPEDLDQAVDHLRIGLQYRSPEINRVDWAYSQLNLGLVYRRRSTGSDLADAEKCYRQGMAYLRPSDNPQLWATLQNNLADVLLVADPADSAGAAASAKAGLRVVDGRHDPVTRARLLWALGRAEDTLHGKLSRPAVTNRRKALQLLSPVQTPDLYRRISGELVDAYGQLGRWQDAADVYADKLIAFNTLYDAQTSVQGRRRVLAGSPTLARWAAYAMARAGRTEEAVEAIENGRARQLSASAARETAHLDRLEAADPYLAGQYRESLAAFRAALSGASHMLTSPDSQQQVSSGESAIQNVLRQIRAIPGFEGFLRPMTVRDIRNAAGGDPVIYLVSAPHGSYALTVMPGQAGPPTVEAEPIPEVTSVDVLRLQMFDYVGDYAPGLLLAQSVDRLRRRKMLPDALDRLIEMQPLVRPVVDVLSRTPSGRVIVVPTGFLGLIPLLATPLPDGNGRVLDDLGEVCFAPSAAAFAACRTRASEHQPERLVGVANPQNSLPRLPGSEAELAAIQTLFESRGSVTCAYGPEPTRSWLLGQVQEATHLHLACHGASEPGNSDGGQLYLAGDTTLTVDDLIDGKLEGCRLAVASACQSGHYSTTGSADEFTGLAAGFLQAGTACAIVSLWHVDDRATAVLMTRLYEILLNPAPGSDQPGPVAALRQARTWLRHVTKKELDDYIKCHLPLADYFKNMDTIPSGLFQVESETKPYSVPQYWAAFTAWGA
jgi:CHAT domain-containing protein/tetratricopeptide (TPR) repeat protein